MTHRALKIIIAGGGTGGHLFPGVAIAQKFRGRNPETEVMFVGAGNPMEKKVLDRYPFKREAIAAEGIKGRGILRQARAMMKLAAGFVQSLRIVFRFGPDLMVGMGGYSAAPVVIAAKIRGCPVVLCEQNILPGITNRVLSRFASRVFVSFADTPGIARKKLFFSGNPTRREIVESARTPELTENSFTVLVLGGSQGAHGINTAVIEAMDHFDHNQMPCFIHQTGEADEPMVKEAYAKRKIPGEVRAFIDDMAEAYRRAHVVVCRAGATTVAEITAVGKPAIFIPFPHAADNHQELNARAVCEAGGALMILQKDLSGKLLAEKIIRFAENPELLKEMSQASARLGRPEAARVIVEECLKLTGI